MWKVDALSALLASCDRRELCVALALLGAGNIDKHLCFGERDYEIRQQEKGRRYRWCIGSPLPTDGHYGRSGTL
jgi:hypothetical protein